MTLLATEFAQWAAASFWVVSVLLLAFSTLAALVQPRIAARRATRKDQPPVSIALPVKLLENCFERAQESAFAQQYPDYEVVAASCEPDSDASRAMRAIFARHPERSTRFLCSTAKIAASPKVDNLVAPFSEAAYDTILMKDANVVLAPDELVEHMRQLAPGVGLVCAIPYCADTPNFASQIEASIVNGPHARMLYLVSCFRQGYGVGKIMLFRRSDFLRAGGFAAISHTVGEDNAFGHALARVGLRTVFSHRPVRQDLGRRSLVEVYQRQLRWSVIRRGDALLTFLFEPFNQAGPAIVAAAVAAPFMGLGPLQGAAATFMLWLVVENLLSSAKGRSLTWGAPLILVAREIVMLTVWIHAWTTNRVVWAKASFGARGDASSHKPQTSERAAVAARKEG
ncbi:glycosyltransferase [Methylocystis bryophila]|uniref:Ceramide glucosyltransferase n=1 Tax=Methylocystis bryophila TaxID=655015 RepID=A0A1W6MUM4_9HYPH|nr:glycosyltransferase [Methylocystis bryophila]ARN81311.1 ceramide glucosyltransferase [Methylocystis bryophila]BDV37281.1 ceramide glucosyltransferase [Methylocystis bryophila]